MGTTFYSSINNSFSPATLYALLMEGGMKGDLFLEDSVLNLTKVTLEGIVIDIFKDQTNEKFCTFSEAYISTCVVICRFCRKIQIATADFTLGKNKYISLI